MGRVQNAGPSGQKKHVQKSSAHIVSDISNLEVCSWAPLGDLCNLGIQNVADSTNNAAIQISESPENGAPQSGDTHSKVVSGFTEAT